MKRSKIFKGFIPSEIFHKKEYLRIRSNKRAFCLVIIINLLLLPLNIKKFIKQYESDEKITVNINVGENNISKDVVLRWLDLANENVDSMNISNGRGSLITRNEDIIYKLEEEGYNINKIVNDKSLITIEVSGDN